MCIREEDEVLTVKVESAKLNSKMSRKIMDMMPDNREFNAADQDLILKSFQRNPYGIKMWNTMERLLIVEEVDRDIDYDPWQCQGSNMSNFCHYQWQWLKDHVTRKKRIFELQSLKSVQNPKTLENRKFQGWQIQNSMSKYLSGSVTI
jgi:hypothetical protein